MDSPVARKVGAVANDMGFYSKSNLRNAMAECLDWPDAFVNGA